MTRREAHSAAKAAEETTMARPITPHLARIAAGWSRVKDAAQPRGLEFEIQYQMDCSWGRALELANRIRLTWPVEGMGAGVCGKAVRS